MDQDIIEFLTQVVERVDQQDQRIAEFEQSVELLTGVIENMEKHIQELRLTRAMLGTTVRFDKNGDANV